MHGVATAAADVSPGGPRSLVGFCTCMASCMTYCIPLVMLCQALLVGEVSAAGAAVEAGLGPGACPLLLSSRHGHRRQKQP